MAATLPAQAAGSGSPGRRDRGMAVLVFCATLIAYWPALGGGFIWNDRDYVTAPALRPLAGLGAIWTQPGATEQYYPLLHSAFWVQHRLWGDQPLGYHVVTLLLHIGAAILFALVLRRLAVPGAWLAALLFALHPVHVESVAWITEQKNTLSLVLYLAAALAYLRYDETRRPRAYGIALGLFLLSLLAKTVTATLPAALLVIFWWQRGRLEWRRDFRPLLPWLVLAAAAGLFSSWVEWHYLGAQGENFDLPLLERGLVAARAVWFYLGQIVWPAGLNFIYPRWTPDAADAGQWLFPLAGLGLTGALWALRRRTRAPLAAWLLFAGSLFPVLGFVNLYGARFSWVWDHWQYLPDLAPLALLAAGWTIGWERLGPQARPAGRALTGLLVLALGLLSGWHTRVFRDEETLYRATLARNSSAWLAHYNLGIILTDLPGRQAEAMAHFEATLRLQPDHVRSYNNLGNLLAADPARRPEAIAHYRVALRLDPGMAVTHYNLGHALMAVPGREAEAIACYEAALRLNPRMTGAHQNLGHALMAIPGREAEAIPHYEAVLRDKPGDPEAHFNLAIALMESPARAAEAVGHLAAVLRMQPDDAEAHFQLGRVLASLPGREAEARVHYEAALRLRPDFAPAREMLDRLGPAPR